MKERTYISIDFKSFYASVECIDRGLNPMTTNLVVADPSRTEKTICLAVSPSLKAFKVVQRIREVNRERARQVPQHKLSGESCFAPELEKDTSLAVDYIVAPPRMAYYMEFSTRIYQIYLEYVAPEDIHVYSIDEVFIDATDYMKVTGLSAKEYVKRILNEVLTRTGITATAGIGTNLYLCKIAMDIGAKNIAADKDGARIAYLDEKTYRQKLWTVVPIGISGQKKVVDNVVNGGTTVNKTVNIDVRGGVGGQAGTVSGEDKSDKNGGDGGDAYGGVPGTGGKGGSCGWFSQPGQPGDDGIYYNYF